METPNERLMMMASALLEGESDEFQFQVGLGLGPLLAGSLSTDDLRDAARLFSKLSDICLAATKEPASA